MYSLFICEPGITSFADIREWFQLMLQRMGYQAEISNTIVYNKINILFAVNVVNCGYRFKQSLPDNSIIIQLEQLYDDSVWIKDIYLDYLRRYEVWDYNQFNQQQLKTKYSISAKVFNFGYLPSIDTIVSNTNEDIDVLFYGGKNPRREFIFSELSKYGVKYVFETNVMGKERENLIKRSKIILNIHSNDKAVFEIARVSYLLNNHKFVITEKSINQDEYEYINLCYPIVNYDEMVDTILNYLKNPEKRIKFVDNAYKIYKTTEMYLPLNKAE
jgi:hypothetical protein